LRVANQDPFSMSGLFGSLFKLLIVVFGLLFAASLLVATAIGAVLGGTLWLLHAAWARLTGRPVEPIRFRVYRSGRFAWRTRRREAEPAPQGYVPGGMPRRVGAPDVTDVDPK
jgi:hypothetical protein